MAVLCRKSTKHRSNGVCACAAIEQKINRSARSRFDADSRDCGVCPLLLSLSLYGWSFIKPATASDVHCCYCCCCGGGSGGEKAILQLCMRHWSNCNYRETAHKTGVNMVVTNSVSYCSLPAQKYANIHANTYWLIMSSLMWNCITFADFMHRFCPYNRWRHYVCMFVIFIRCDKRTSNIKDKKQSQNDVEYKAAKPKKL